MANVSEALGHISGNEGANVSSLLSAARRALEQTQQFDDSLGPVSELLESADIHASEAADALQRYAETIETDPVRQEHVEQRLDSMQRIARKHHVEPDALPELLQKLRADLDELENAELRGRDLEEELTEAEQDYFEHARALSKQRSKAALELSGSVAEAMSGLGMPGGRFHIRLSELGVEAARASGIDDIEFRISANPGQPLMPLSRVASGGELSRMSLAIQVIASDGSSIPTMVFDEVDSGVGGGVAEMVGRRLAEVAGGRQVLCVTHLPQVASLADQHLRISKVSDGNATRTRVNTLDHEERVDELARMLGGVEITHKTREHAAEMLAGVPKKRA